MDKVMAPKVSGKTAKSGGLLSWACWDAKGRTVVNLSAAWPERGADGKLYVNGHPLVTPSTI